MNDFKTRMGTGLLRQGAFGSRLFRGMFTTIAIAGLAVAATNAHASCANFAGPGAAGAVKMPLLQSELAPATTGTSPTIVGLWGVIYTADGAVFNQTFDTWHSDGTEFENAFVPLAGGNVCEGVWKTVGTSVKLHHIGWTYGPAVGTVANGTFTLDQIITVAASGNSYTGTFTYNVYDMKGNVLKTVTGTIAAVRITVE